MSNELAEIIGQKLPETYQGLGSLALAVINTDPISSSNLTSSVNCSALKERLTDLQYAKDWYTTLTGTEKYLIFKYAKFNEECPGVLNESTPLSLIKILESRETELMELFKEAVLDRIVKKLNTGHESEGVVFPPANMQEREAYYNENNSIPISKLYLSLCPLTVTCNLEAQVVTNYIGYIVIRQS